MRILLRKLPLAILIPVVLLGFLSFYHISSYKAIEEMFEIEKSQNQEASKHFIKASAYSTYIQYLNKIVAYDNVLMKPFMYMRDYHFKKGKALLGKDSVEDIFWWTLVTKEINGLVATDSPLAYTHLPWQEHKKKYEEVYNKIIRYSKGEIFFDSKQIVENRFRILQILISGYKSETTLSYPGKTLMNKTSANYSDENYKKRLQKILTIYEEAYKQYLKIENKDTLLIYRYYNDLVSISRDILFGDIYRISDFYKETCQSHEVKIIIKNMPYLLNYYQNNNNNLSKVIFEENIYYDNILVREVIKKALLTRCKEFYPQLSLIYKTIQKLNK